MPVFESISAKLLIKKDVPAFGVPTKATIFLSFVSSLVKSALSPTGLVFSMRLSSLLSGIILSASLFFASSANALRFYGSSTAS